MADTDVSTPNAKTDENDRPNKRPLLTHSRFFSAPSRLTETPNAVAGPSRSPSPLHEEPTLPEIDDVDLDMGEIDAVAQEDGYLSPTGSFTRLETPDFSSPLRPAKTSAAKDDGFGAEILSSPVAPKARVRGKPNEPSVTAQKFVDQKVECVDIDSEDEGPDLRGGFAEDLTSEIDCPEPENSFTSTTSSASSGPFTPVGFRRGPFNKAAPAKEGEKDDGDEAASHQVRTSNVANGWLQKWAYGGEKQMVSPESHLSQFVLSILMISY